MSGFRSSRYLLEHLDLTQMFLAVQQHHKMIYYIISNNFCFNNFAKKSISGDIRAQVLQVLVGVSGPHPDGHGHPETTKINLFYHTQQLLLQQHYQKVIPWDTPGSMPYSWMSEAVDLTQMVIDIQKQLK